MLFVSSAAELLGVDTGFDRHPTVLVLRGAKKEVSTGYCGLHERRNLCIYRLKQWRVYLYKFWRSPFFLYIALALMNVWLQNRKRVTFRMLLSKFFENFSFSAPRCTEKLSPWFLYLHLQENLTTCPVCKWKKLQFFISGRTRFENCCLKKTPVIWLAFGSFFSVPRAFETGDHVWAGVPSWKQKDNVKFWERETSGPSGLPLNLECFVALWSKF